MTTNRAASDVEETTETSMGQCSRCSAEIAHGDGLKTIDADWMEIVVHRDLRICAGNAVQ